MNYSLKLSVLKLNFIPKACWTLGYKWEVNLGSRFETIDTGTPCNLTTLFTYNFANLSTESVIFIDKKSIYLVNRSTMNQTSSLPPFPLGNPDTKSMVIFSHFHSGISRPHTQPLLSYSTSGCEGPAGFWCLVLILNHFSHTQPHTIISGCEGLAGFWCSTFTCWHTSYLATYSTTSLIIFGHQ
jgi:hypothetical protein